MEILIGMDFGSDSVRAIAVDAADGRTLAENVGVFTRWKQKDYCDANRQIFRQHPSDYLEAMTKAVRGVADQLSEEQRQAVKAIGTDATGSTVCPLDREGIPLALLPEFSKNPNAMFYLWKDHSASEEAREINATFAAYPKYDYQKYQGIYSAEWFWAKILHGSREDPAVACRAYTWAELADWIPALLTGKTKPEEMYRCACAAGHKALWNSHFGGMPEAECLQQLDSVLRAVAATYPAKPGMATDVVGKLLPVWSRKFHLPENVLVSGSSLDAHAGAVGAGIKPRTLIKVIGTSTVDMAVAKESDIDGKPIQGTCGLAENSILPGYIGIEAGQAAFGDIFAWFQNLLSWPLENNADIPQPVQQKIVDGLLDKLEETLGKTKDTQDMVMLDWFNGRRYPNNDDNIRSAAIGFSLGSNAPDLYRALVKGAVMGSKAIFDSLQGAGVEVDRVIAVGGIAQKSDYIMQLLADALNRNVLVAKTHQTCALGAAMYAAVAAGCYPDLLKAQRYMNTGYTREYRPNQERYNELEGFYRKYLRLAGMTNQWYRETGKPS